jgi:hypothetical protein
MAHAAHGKLTTIYNSNLARYRKSNKVQRGALEPLPPPEEIYQSKTDWGNPKARLTRERRIIQKRTKIQPQTTIDP